MSKLSNLIDCALCAVLMLVSLAMLVWFSAELLAVGSTSGWAATSMAALSALGWR